MSSRVTYALLVLFAINTLNFFDRTVLGAIAEPLRREWGLGDGTLGALGTAFTLLYAAVGVPFGRLADRAPRRWILAGGAFVWSLLTALSGFARGYWQLFALRLGVGVGEASCAPAATSLIGDLVPPARRARALSVFMLGLPIGIALSYFLGGRIAAKYGWRTAFLIAGAPGILIAILALFIAEPARGSADGGRIGTTPRRGSPYLLVLSIPTLWWVILSGALHNFNMYAIGSFISPFLMRFHELKLEEAGDVAAVVYGLSGLPGLFVGGWLADLARKRWASGRLLLAALAALLSVPFVLLALARPAGDVRGFLLLMTGACALMYVYYSSVYATIQDVVEPSLRGTAMAIYFFAMYVLGASLGPLVTGGLSDHFTRSAAARAGVTAPSGAALEPFRAEGLHGAMYLIPILGVILAAVLYAGSRTAGKDMERTGPRCKAT